MKKTLLSLIFSFIILASYSQNLTKNFIDKNYIEVTGFACKTITPNQIYLHILINEKDLKNKNLAKTEKAMIDKLKEIGVNVNKELTAKDLSSDFEYHWAFNSDILLSKEYRLLVHDAITAGEVFSQLKKLGISNISVAEVSHSEIEKLKKDVKIQAMQSAKDDAKSLATAIGQKIGRALFINANHHENLTKEYSYANIYTARVRGAPTKKNLSSSKPNIKFEKIKLAYQVTARFALE